MPRLTYFFNKSKNRLNYFNSRLDKLERKINMLCSCVSGKSKPKKLQMYQYNKRGVDGRFVCKPK